jgi:hypothetical protein
MEIIQIHSPYQGVDTVNKQRINGEYPKWCVVTEHLPVDTDYQTWITKKKEYCEKEGISGIYLYNIQPIFVQPPNQTALAVRYAYIMPKVNNTSSQWRLIRDQLDLDDPEIKALYMRWDKGDCSTIGLCEILMFQLIKKHKEEQGVHYNTDFDEIKLRYGN